MKRCPYCAEEIQDAAIKCRFCQSWLVDEIPASAQTPPPGVEVHHPIVAKPVETPEPEGVAEPEEAPRIEEVAPIAGVAAAAGPSSAESAPTEVAPASETALAESAPAGAARVTETAPTESAPTEVAPAAETAPTGSAAAATPEPEQKIEFTHSGERYLLGYGHDFFGIWDRQAPAMPVERFPRNDAGWSQAWQRYSSIEHNWMDLRSGQRAP